MRLPWPTRSHSARATRNLLAAALLFATAGCGKRMAELNRLAAAGSIDRSAPVTAHAQVDIDAPAGRVWAMLIDLPSWPQWQHGITSVRGSALTPDASFTWTIDGTRIHARVQRFEPPRQLSWTGRAYTAKAIHVWALTALTPDRTRVTVDESIGGPGIATLFPSQQLQTTATNWLTALKRQVEAE